MGPPLSAQSTGSLICVAPGGSGELCNGQYPPGAVGYTPVAILPNGKKKNGNGNTFEDVSPSIMGSCPRQTLVADQSVARPCQTTMTLDGKSVCLPSILSGVQALNCGDQLNLDNGDYTTASTRTVADLCPACSNTSLFSDDTSVMYGADGHIDAFSSNTSCTGKGVGNLGFFYTSYPTN
jgi:hypothetical protein